MKRPANPGGHCHLLARKQPLVNVCQFLSSRSSVSSPRDRHDGVSEVEELQSLADSEVHVIELRYWESKRQDEHGNWFRYRAKVRDARGAQVGRWAWDVFLHTTNYNN